MHFCNKTNALNAQNLFFMQKFLILSLLFFPLFLFSQTGIITLKGKIEKKPWTKTEESYCAGGSEYFVLNCKFGNLVLQYPLEKLEKWKGKKVSVKGEITQITKVPPQDEISQHPVSISPDGKKEDVYYVCKVLVVSEIKKSK